MGEPPSPTSWFATVKFAASAAKGTQYSLVRIGLGTKPKASLRQRKWINRTVSCMKAELPSAFLLPNTLKPPPEWAWEQGAVTILTWCHCQSYTPSCTDPSNWLWSCCRCVGSYEVGCKWKCLYCLMGDHIQDLSPSPLHHSSLLHSNYYYTHSPMKKPAAYLLYVHVCGEINSCHPLLWCDLNPFDANNCDYQPFILRALDKFLLQMKLVII